MNRNKLSQKILAYTSRFYSGGACATISNEKVIKVLIMNQVLNPSNFYSGQFMADYTIEGEELRVNFRINVHYYENGNVQMKTIVASKEYLDDTLSDDQDSDRNELEIKDTDEMWARDVVKKMERMEVKFFGGIESKYQGLEEAFKSLKRSLPITRSKMDWFAVSNCKHPCFTHHSFYLSISYS